MLKVCRIIWLLAFFLCLNEIAAYGSDDGFGRADKIASAYFNIYYSPQLDVSDLARRLNIGVSDRLLAGKGIPEKKPAQLELADMVDVLFLRISDILDMHLYSFQGSIKICRTNAELIRLYSNLFRQNPKELVSFYSYDLNTIYISAESFKRGILGHEIAHAIMSRYFVVSPPLKVSEVLSTYVEYQLRKTTE